MTTNPASTASRAVRTARQVAVPVNSSSTATARPPTTPPARFSCATYDIKPHSAPMAAPAAAPHQDGQRLITEGSSRTRAIAPT
jgi:hypothetical protein